jgi:hypothetical protein
MYLQLRKEEDGLSELTQQGSALQDLRKSSEEIDEDYLCKEL